jgi:serine/threonine protein kinase
MSPVDPLLDLLDQAMELNVSEREAFVRERCTGDPELLKRALPLILEEETSHTDEWDLSSSRTLIAPVLDQPAYPLLGRQIGPWKLTRGLGEGGMGTVYLGDRMDEAFTQEVAVKVIRAGIAHSQTLDRFHQERQIQAGLDHPAIAGLIDAGHTKQGLPYFVMEYVPGVRIDDLCESKDLEPEQRVRLIQEACVAVQYLHDRGIVHRDLKPSNLMVQPNGRTKLLDFGVAQVLNQTALTANKPLPFVTPAYASPECLRDGSASPASDQYSLAVILHELLTDRRPTTRQSTLPATRDNVRQIDFDKLQRGSLARFSPRDPFMRRLKAILSRALHVDASERYASVDEFRQDLERLVNGQPVLALGRSPWQTLRQVIVSHRLTSAASLAFIGTLTGLLIHTQGQVQLRRTALAKSESSRAAAEDHALTMERFAKEIFTGLEGRLSLVPEASALREQSLAMGTAFFESGQWNGPVPKRLLKTLLTSYWTLGLLRMNSITQGSTDIEGSRKSFHKVLELAPLLLDQDPTFTLILLATTEGDLGGLETDQLRLVRGHELIQSSLARFEKHRKGLADSTAVRAHLRSMIYMAINLGKQGELDQMREALLKFQVEYELALVSRSQKDALFLGSTRPLLCRAGLLWYQLGDLTKAQQMLDDVMTNEWNHPQDFRGSQFTSSLGKSQQFELQMLLQEPGPERGDLASIESLISSLDHKNPKDIGSPAGVANLHRLRALMLLERDRRLESDEAFMRCFRILRHALHEDPSNAAWRDSLARTLILCSETFDGKGISKSRRQSMLQEARGHLENLRQKGADSPAVLQQIQKIDAQFSEQNQR